jgi:hypothetical protein
MARCLVEGCQGQSKAKGLCGLHYERQRILAAPLCSVADCNNRAEKRGLCGKHYFRSRMHGDPLAGRAFNGEAEKFVFEFIDPKTDECVIWPFSLSGNDYPAAIGELGSAHRAICQLFHGNPPSEIHEAAHSCGNRPCINPRHLRWALPIENEADKILGNYILNSRTPRCGGHGF